MTTSLDSLCWGAPPRDELRETRASLLNVIQQRIDEQRADNVCANLANGRTYLTDSSTVLGTPFWAPAEQRHQLAAEALLAKPLGTPTAFTLANPHNGRLLDAIVEILTEFGAYEAARARSLAYELVYDLAQDCYRHPTITLTVSGPAVRERLQHPAPGPRFRTFLDLRKPAERDSAGPIERFARQHGLI